MSMAIKSKFLLDLEEINRRKLRDPITLNLWLERAEQHIRSIELSKPVAVSPIAPATNPSTPIIPTESPDNMLRKEVEKTLLSTIAPEDYQINTLLMTLRTFVKWQNKKERSVIAEYETLIRKAIIALKERLANTADDNDDIYASTQAEEE